MPLNTQHNRGKIIYNLTHRKFYSDVISAEELSKAMNDAGLESEKTQKQYTAKMEDLQQITRVPGGWKLSESCYQTGRILVTVSPADNTGQVMRAISDAIRRFRPLTTIEVEA